MTREEAIAKLRKCAEDEDVEVAHDDADRVLCELLESLGYADVVEAWHKVPKWYA